MARVKQFVITAVIAVLFAIFIFSSLNAFYPKPEYQDFCDDKEFEPPLTPGERSENCTEPDFNETEMQQCTSNEGEIRYEYNESGCKTSWNCNYCRKEYNDAEEKHSAYSFIIAAIAGLLGILGGLYYLKDGEEVKDWISSGFVVGGVIAIFVATIMFFEDLHKWIRPVIILFEMILVIWLSYKVFSNE